MLTRGGSFILPVTADSLGWDVTETKAIQVKRWQAWRTSGLQLWRGLIVQEKESSWMEADQCENKKGNHRVCHLLLWNTSASQSHNQIQTTSFFTKYNEESGGNFLLFPPDTSQHLLQTEQHAALSPIGLSDNWLSGTSLNSFIHPALPLLPTLRERMCRWLLSAHIPSGKEDPSTMYLI